MLAKLPERLRPPVLPRMLAKPPGMVPEWVSSKWMMM
jgi:hypothetical protein